MKDTGKFFSKTTFLQTKCSLLKNEYVSTFSNRDFFYIIRADVQVIIEGPITLYYIPSLDRKVSLVFLL